MPRPKKKKGCKKKTVRKQWLEDLVVNQTMQLVRDDAAMESIMAERGLLPMRRSKLRRAGSIAATYLLVAALAVLGWLWHSLPAEILLEPGQTLTLPRFAYVQPLRTAGSRNAASTQAAGSYQATLSIGGWLPVKTVRALVETRPVVTVCGTPFGVKMFSRVRSLWAFPT